MITARETLKQENTHKGGYCVVLARVIGKVLDEARDTAADSNTPPRSPAARACDTLTQTPNQGTGRNGKTRCWLISKRS